MEKQKSERARVDELGDNKHRGYRQQAEKNEAPFVVTPDMLRPLPDGHPNKQFD